MSGIPPPSMPATGNSASPQLQQQQQQQHQQPQQQQPQQQQQPSQKTKIAISDQAVLEYLRAKGMGSALMELQDKLKKETSSKTNSSVDPNNPKAVEQQEMMELKEKLEHDDDIARNQRTPLYKSTGGGFGYDRDAAAPIVQWGIPNNTFPTDSAAAAAGAKPMKKNLAAHIGEKEAQAYLEAFTSLQLWVLTLPDDPDTGHNLQPKTHDPIAKAKELISKNTDKKISLASMLKQMNEPVTRSSKASSDDDIPTFRLPPSAKPELLAVTFALLVHTYCELLEVGMESTAHVLRDTFGPSIYEPIYGEELKDLFHVTTTEDMVELNNYNFKHTDNVSQLKARLVRIAEYQLKQEEIRKAPLPTSAQQDEAKKAAAERARQLEIEKYQKAINTYKQQYSKISQQAANAINGMHDVPFLRRARAVRWQLTLSSASYGLLASFLSNTSADQSLLAMSTLLQTKCEVHVEQRDPLPVTPAVLMDDGDDGEKDLAKTALCNWAAPSRTALKTRKNRPFPKYHLEEEYENESTAKRDKKMVEFNRAMLVFGFRRLEALERKREFQTTKKSPAAPAVVSNPLEPSILLSTLCANTLTSFSDPEISSSPSKHMLPPPVPLSSTASTSSMTRKTSSNGTGIGAAKNVMTAAMWEEAGIGLTCAKLCPPDGRRIAVGCDDAAIRIWDLMGLKKDGTAGDAAQVLLGHKNGFPVFDVSWNRDGRSLLSAGGDGTIRLWDTMLQGPYGEVAENLTASTTMTSPKKTSEKAVTNAVAKETLEKATNNLEQAKVNPDMSVPGLRPESNYMQPSGAALAVYRHAEQKPIWSTAFAPCGYYFASAGADATARLWTTDRVVPVRIFCGHTSNSVNSVVFHPNCNYILTGSDDKTARLWDIQTGKCVRLLNGCPSGLYQVQIDPSGQYAAGADATGSIHLWDLGTSKKVTEFRPPAGMRGKKNNNQYHKNMAMCHSLSFSPCSTALASGGDDRCVRIWDVRKAIQDHKPIVDIPVKSMPTRRTIVMDLHYTKRNLLLSVGKYINQ